MLILDFPQVQLTGLLGEDPSGDRYGLDIAIHYAQVNNTSDPATNQGLKGYSNLRVSNFAATTDAEIILGGLANESLVIKSMTFCNNDSIDHTLTLALKDQTATYLILQAISIPAGKTLVYEDGSGFIVVGG